MLTHSLTRSLAHSLAYCEALLSHVLAAKTELDILATPVTTGLHIQSGTAANHYHLAAVALGLGLKAIGAKDYRG